MLVLATARPRSACGHAAFEVAQEAAHAPAAAAGEPRGGGDGGLVRLDVGVVLLLVPRRPARRGRGPGLGSEERRVVVVAGGHGGVAGVASIVRCQGSARRIEIWRREGMRARAREAKRRG